VRAGVGGLVYRIHTRGSNMVATRFNQDISIASRHKSVAAEAQRIADDRK
jgi:hypothetical protein